MSLPSQIVNANTVLGISLQQQLCCSTLPKKVSVRAILQLFQALNMARIDSLWNAVGTYVASMMAFVSLHEV